MSLRINDQASNSPPRLRPAPSTSMNGSAAGWPLSFFRIQEVAARVHHRTGLRGGPAT